MSRKPAKLATTTHVALFTTIEPFGVAIATGVEADKAYALAHSFACVAVALDDRLPEGCLGALRLRPFRRMSRPCPCRRSRPT